MSEEKGQIAIKYIFLLVVTGALLLGTRTLLGAPGLTSSNKNA